MISEKDAIEAVHRFRSKRGLALIDKARSTVRRDVVVERDTWVVNAQEALSSDEPDWMQQEYDGGPVPHFVDADTGVVFGYHIRSHILFDPVDRARHEADLAERHAASSLRAVVRRWWGRK